MQGQYRRHRLHPARGPLQMPEMPLDRGDGNVSAAEYRAQRTRLREIPSTVAVAWAFTWTTSTTCPPASRTARRTASATPAPDGSGAAMWWASADRPHPAASQ